MRSIALKIITIAILPLLFTSLMGCGPDTSENRTEDTNKQSCTPNPCKNGGTCQVNNGNAVCTCPDGYTGDHCETTSTQTVDPCATNPCQNGGTCQANNGNAVCTCPDGFTGDHCETESTQTPDPCATNPCQNGGTCKVQNDAAVCTCPDEYIGDHCETAKGPCAPNPCQNGGTCSVVGDQFKCACPSGHHGHQCQLEVTSGPFVFGVTIEKSPFKFRIETLNDSSYNYDFNVDCNNDGTFEANNLNSTYECTYTAAGEYTISITGNYPALKLRSQHGSVTSVKQWGEQRWKSMANMFQFNYMFQTIEDTNPPILDDAVDLSATFTNAVRFNGDVSKWDVTNITNMSGLFNHADKFNGDISKWNTSNVTDMSYMFSNATNFDGDISKWNTSKVTNMDSMFLSALSFNQNLSDWDVSNVTNMNGMFADAAAFNQNISAWNVSNVTEVSDMFFNATSFNQDLSNWNVTNVIKCTAFYDKTSPTWPISKHPKFTKCAY